MDITNQVTYHGALFLAISSSSYGVFCKEKAALTDRDRRLLRKIEILFEKIEL